MNYSLNLKLAIAILLLHTMNNTNWETKNEKFLTEDFNQFDLLTNKL